MSFFQRLTSKDVSKKVESLQLIDGEGTFDAAGLEAFSKYHKLQECGLSYAVVAIMGPQSSGKSTLLNHLFSTSFTEMDAFTGRTQTTQGVWLARAANIEPCTLVMDLEGTDGGERGEDDTAFEKQSALFALAVSDIVLINMWCHDIGREQAANKPLLKIVFQVMMRLFSPRKTTLLFVIRDKTRTPMEILEPKLREDVDKIWDSVPKPTALQDATLGDCFNVQVTALSNFEDKPEVFKDQVADLRERFNNSIVQGGLAGDRRGVVPGTAFPVSTRSIWDVVRDNKDLDLPAHKVMVATVRCEEIANEKLAEFLQDEEWMGISERAQHAAISAFGPKISTLLDKYISAYDQEVSYFDENVRVSKRNFLLQKALEAVHPAYQQILAHHRVETTTKFKRDLKDWADSPEPEVTFAVAVRQCKGTAMRAFDSSLNDAQVTYAQWDASKLREKVLRDMDAHAASVRTEKINSIVSFAESRLQKNIGEATSALLESATPGTWPAIREVLAKEVEKAHSALSNVLTGYELDEATEKSVLQGLAAFGRKVVDTEARKEASQALLRMKDRFTTTFSHDSEALPRLWSDKDDIRAIARDARSSSLRGLSVIAAIRLDGKTNDPVEPALATLLGDSQDRETQKALEGAADSEGSSVVNSNPLAAGSWDGIAAEETLLTPTQCRNIWKQFKSETDYAISQALAAQEATRNSKSWLPPPWAIAAMIVLGFNEFMALLRNPLYLLVGFVIYLLGRALWVQLDLKAEFRHGVVPGMLSVSTKIVPTVMNFLTRLAEEGSRAAAPGQTPGNSSILNSSLLSRSGSDLSQDMDESEVSGSDGSLRTRQRRRAVAMQE